MGRSSLPPGSRTGSRQPYFRLSAPSRSAESYSWLIPTSVSTGLALGTLTKSVFGVLAGGLTGAAFGVTVKKMYEADDRRQKSR